MRGRGAALMIGMAAGRRQAEQQQAQQEQAYQQGQQQAAPAPAAAPSQDITAELQKLTDLHKSGALSDEEFAAAKKKLLG